MNAAGISETSTRRSGCSKGQYLAVQCIGDAITIVPSEGRRRCSMRIIILWKKKENHNSWLLLLETKSLKWEMQTGKNTSHFLRMFFWMHWLQIGGGISQRPLSILLTRISAWLVFLRWERQGAWAVSPVPSLLRAAHTQHASLVPNFRKTTSE